MYYNCCFLPAQSRGEILAVIKQLQDARVETERILNSKIEDACHDLEMRMQELRTVVSQKDVCTNALLNN